MPKPKEASPIRLRTGKFFNNDLMKCVPFWVMEDAQTRKRWEYHIHFDFNHLKNYFTGVQAGLVPYNEPTEYQEMFGPTEFQFHFPCVEWGIGPNPLQHNLDVILGTVLRTLRVHISRDPLLGFNEKYRLIHPLHLEKLRDPDSDIHSLREWIKNGGANLTPDPETHACFSLDYTISVDRRLFEYNYAATLSHEVVGEIAITFVNGVLIPHFHFKDVVDKKVIEPPKQPNERKRKNNSNNGKFCFWREKLMKYK